MKSYSIVASKKINVGDGDGGCFCRCSRCLVEMRPRSHTTARSQGGFETLVKMRRPKRGSVLNAEKKLSSSVCLVLVCATFRATVGVKEKGKMVKEESREGRRKPESKSLCMHLCIHLEKLSFG